MCFDLNGYNFHVYPFFNCRGMWIAIQGQTRMKKLWKVLMATMKELRRRQSQVITCIKITCKITNGISVKAIDTSGFIVLRTIYTSHTGQYMPKHAVFECSAVCLHVSVIII